MVLSNDSHELSQLRVASCNFVNVILMGGAFAFGSTNRFAVPELWISRADTDRRTF